MLRRIVGCEGQKADGAQGVVTSGRGFCSQIYSAFDSSVLCCGGTFSHVG